MTKPLGFRLCFRIKTDTHRNKHEGEQVTWYHQFIEVEGRVKREAKRENDRFFSIYRHTFNSILINY